MRLLLRGIAGVVLLVGPASPQEVKGPGAKPAAVMAYTVVSVRLTKDERESWVINDLPNGLRVRAATLNELIGEAYGFSVGPLSEQELAGEPKWAKTAKFDIDAKIDDADIAQLKAEDARWNDMVGFIGAMSARTPTTRMLMLRALLADRFQLRVHDEVKELPVYRMVIAKSGPKLAKAKDSEHGSLNWNGGELTAQGVPVILLPSFLATEMGHPILDATGLKGTYDFTLKWTPVTQIEGSAAAAGGTDSPMLLTALQEQLGLRLEAGKGPVHVTVVDAAAMPGVN